MSIAITTIVTISYGYATLCEALLAVFFNLLFYLFYNCLKIWCIICSFIFFIQNCFADHCDFPCHLFGKNQKQLNIYRFIDFWDYKY